MELIFGILGPNGAKLMAGSNVQTTFLEILIHSERSIVNAEATRHLIWVTLSYSMSVTISFGILNLVIFHEIVMTFQTGWVLTVMDVEHTIPVLILVGSR